MWKKNVKIETKKKERKKERKKENQEGMKKRSKAYH